MLDNFYPYDAFERSSMTHGWFWAEYLEIVWNNQSFVANAAAYPDLDFENVRRSIKVHHTFSFETPFPWLNDVQV
jgi:hypothetical protein